MKKTFWGAPLALVFGCAAGCATPQTMTAPNHAAAPHETPAGLVALLEGGADAATRAHQLLLRDTTPLGRLGAALAADELGDRTAALTAWLDAAERAIPIACDDLQPRRGCDPWAQPVLRVATAALGAAIDDLASLRALGDRALALSLDKLTPAQAGDLHLIKASVTARRGDRATADRHLRAAGCGGSFYIAGPFGELATLDLDTPYEHNTTRPQKPLGCRVLLDGPRGRSGVLYAGRKLEVAAAERIVLELEDTGPFRIVLDGATVFAMNEDDRPPPGNRRVELTLSAGTHDLWIKVAAPDGRLEIGATLLASNKVKVLDLAPSGAPERPMTKQNVARLLEEPLVARASAAGHAVTTPRAQVELLVGALLALAERDADAAEELSLALAAVHPRAATAQMLLGLAYLVDNSRPARFSSDLARRAMTAALSLRPTFLRATESLVELDLAEDRARAATTRLAPIPLGRDWRLDILRYRALRARSLGEQGEVALHAAEHERPLACPVLAALTQLYRDRRELAELATTSESYSRCAEGREIKAELAADRFDFPTAITEYRRLLERSPLRHNARRELARALRSAGKTDEAVAELTALVEAVPKNTVYRIELADALVDAGHRDRAVTVLTAGQKEQPESDELSRALLVLDGKPRASRWLEPFRVDGLQLIADYRKDTQPPDRAPAVLVLDRTVLYLFPSGARLTLTHNIIQLLSKEGISKFAEVEVPEGAELLRLRVIKRDGSVREAEMVSGKQTPSLPDLDVGDFIELEHVEPTATPAAFPGGFLSERFYFQSFDAPLDRSEYVVVAPKAMPLQIDSRGAAPTVKEEARGDETIVRTWQVRRAAQSVPEPEAVPHAEYLPSVRVAAGLSADQWRRFLVNSQATLLRPNREMRRLVEQLTADRGTALERLQALDTWVRLNIQGGGSIDERASFVLERKQGSRSLLLLALLRLAHVDAEMVLARPIGSAELDGALPDLEGFNEPLLRVRIGNEWRAVDPRYRHGPAGILSPRLRGAEALRIAVGGDTRITLPTANHDGRKMTIDFAISETLGARVKVTEHLTGVPALEWREAIETLAADRIRPEFEQQTLGQHFPGASLVSLGWQHEKDDHQPLVVQYEFTLPTVGRRIDRALFLSAPYPALLLRRYAVRKQRRTSLRVGFVAPTEIETTYHGAVVPESIAPVEVTARFGSFSLRGERSEQALRLVTRLAMPTAVVKPVDYDDFVQFASVVDRAELTAAKIVK